MVISVVAWVGIVMAVGGILGGLPMIGKERGEFTASSYVCLLIQAMVMGLLAGRALGWW